MDAAAVGERIAYNLQRIEGGVGLPFFDDAMPEDGKMADPRMLGQGLRTLREVPR